MGKIVPFFPPASPGETSIAARFMCRGRLRNATERFRDGYDPFVPVYVPDRVHACLLRRIDATMERRRAAAMMPDDDAAFALWCRDRDRGDKLRRALIAWLSRPF
jgi:hypothetical protein